MYRVALGTVAIILVLLLSACDTKNVVEPYNFRPPPQAQITFAASGGDTVIQGGGSGTATVLWDGGIGPFTIEIDFGGACTEDIHIGTSQTGIYVTRVTFVNPSRTDNATYQGTFSVTDCYGAVSPGTFTLTVGRFPGHQPQIDDVSYQDGSLTVDVSDGDSEDTLTVSVTDITGLTVDTNSKTATQVSGRVVFNWIADDKISGGNGTTTITVDDGWHQTTQDIAISVDPILIPEGTLVAMPNPTIAGTGEEIVISVISGDFPAAQPFNYCNGAAVTLTAGATYVAGSFNVGAPGGETKATDGIWSEMGTAPTSYLIPDDFMLAPMAVDGDDTIEFISCNITPISGEDITSGGVLFNFAVTYSTPGVKRLGFLEFQDVKRTYYSSNDATEYNWADISNNIDGLPNSITIL